MKEFIMFTATTDGQCFAFGSGAMTVLRRMRDQIPKERTQAAIDETALMEKLVLRGLIGEPSQAGELGVGSFPPELTSELLAKAALLGLRPVFFTDQEISADRQMSDEWIKPETWFYQQITEGKISTTAKRLYCGWYLVDFTLSVDYAQEGKQVFPNDPLAWDFFLTLFFKVKYLRSSIFDFIGFLLFTMMPI